MSRSMPARHLMSLEADNEITAVTLSVLVINNEANKRKKISFFFLQSAAAFTSLSYVTAHVARSCAFEAMKTKVGNV